MSKTDRDRAYRHKHREEIARRKAEYQRSHKEQLREYHRAYYARKGHIYHREYDKQRRDQKREYDQQYRKANYERIRERQRRWERDNQQHVRLYKRAAAMKRYSVVYNAEGYYTDDDIQRQYGHQHGKCYYCGERVGKKYHVDHVVPVSRGGTNWPDNLVIACGHCNCTKNDRMPHEWPEGGRLL